MRKILFVLMSLLTSGCEQSPAPPSPAKMFQTRNGLLVKNDIAFLQAQTANFSPEDVAYFEDVANARSRDELQKTLLSGRSCLTNFRRASPVADAQTAFDRNDLRLYNAGSNGFSAYNFVPGTEHCPGTYNGSEARVRFLRNPAPGDGPHYAIVDECDRMMISYATQYNRTMVKLAPQSLVLSCGGSRRARLAPEAATEN